MKRNIFNKINELLNYFPVVAILGARQAGKTTLARQLRPEWQYYDCERPAVFQRIQHDPELFFEQNQQHIIVDEAQELPVIFNVLRGIIDENRAQKGRFILTGSSSPELLDNISESLAGRVAIIELETLKTNELFQAPLSEFYCLFSDTLSRDGFNDFMNKNKQAPLTKQQIHQSWLYGGYPEPVLAKNKNYYDAWMENYYQTYINRDVAKLFPRLNKVNYQRFISMLGYLSGTIINKAELARNLEVSQPTISQYLDIADKTYVWRQLSSFEKNITKSIVKMPKGLIRDSGLRNYLQQIHSVEVLFSHPFVGNAFETFVIEEIIKGLQATTITHWNSYYYRTRNGAEIDLIVEGNFGQLPIEIKYGINTPIKQLRTLEQYIEEHQLPLGIVVNQADQIAWLTKNILQVPVRWL
jgi:predicted AAA+ superfamily ATPase